MTTSTLREATLTRLLHAHPQGLGKEVLDHYDGEKAVAGMLKTLQDEGLIHHGCVQESGDAISLQYPVKLSSAGVEAAKQLDGATQAS